MTQKNIWLSILAIAIIAVGIYWAQSSKTSTDNQIAPVDNKNQIVPAENKKSVVFTELTSQELSDMLPNKDFTLVDVHIPEQVHIPGTDYMIPYNNIEALVSTLPEKNAKIVLYCRSGGMSKVVAKALAEKGYTNIFNLTKGMNEWSGQDRETVAKGTIPTGVLPKN